MNKLTQILLISVPLLTISFTSNAHDPKLHAKKAEKANCAPLQKMKNENKKMDMTDPVMIAMTKKCEKQAQSKEMKHMEHKGEHSEKTKHDKMVHKKVEHKKMKEKKKDDGHTH